MSDAISAEVKALIMQLSARDAARREHARAELIELGGSEVTRALMVELNDPRSNVRWEAAKCLCSISDPSAAAALAVHLDDDDPDVRWLAAEALAQLGDDGLTATLTGAIRLATSRDYCRAAHHVFHEYQRRGKRVHLMTSLMQACVGPQPALSLPVEAFRALFQLQGKVPAPVAC